MNHQPIWESYAVKNYILLKNLSYKAFQNKMVKKWVFLQQFKELIARVVYFVYILSKQKYGGLFMIYISFIGWEGPKMSASGTVIYYRHVLSIINQLHGRKSCNQYNNHELNSDVQYVDKFVCYRFWKCDLTPWTQTGRELLSSGPL